MLPSKNQLGFKLDTTLFASAKMGLLPLPSRAISFVLKLTILGIIFLMSLVSCKKDDETSPTPNLTAQAGADQTVAVGQTVSLEGSTSTDSKGGVLNFSWIYTKKPEGSTSVLINATQANPSFVIDVAGIYEIELTVSNVNGQAKDKVLITATAGTSTQTISGPITSARLLKNNVNDPAVADYRVTDHVDVSAQLTIETGVVIEFEADKGLTIQPNGALVAKGTAASPIIFTGKNKTQGFWKGIAFFSNSSLNELEYVTVEHGGSSNISGIPIELKANIAVLVGTTNPAAALKISNSTIASSGGFGLYVHNQSNLTAFSTNTFQNNAGSAIYIPARQVHKLDVASRFSANNGYNGVQTGGSIKESSEVTWPVFTDGSTYYASTDINIESGLKLTERIQIEFNPGVVMRVTGQGYLQATGSIGNPVVFTARSKTEQDYWGGLLFESASTQNKLEYSQISYAGNKALTGFADTKANVAVAASGKLSIQYSQINFGLGWGIAALTDLGAILNSDAATSNAFENITKGIVKWTSADNTTTLEGDWLDSYTFNLNRSISESFYDPQSGIWFKGASTPWSMQPQAGFGLSITDNGKFIWTIAEYGPWVGCGNSYSAEYITGQVTKQVGKLTFQQNYWRSMFYNPCDQSQNVDTAIEPVLVEPSYEIYRENNNLGQEYWVLKLINADNTFFTYYRR